MERERSFIGIDTSCYTSSAACVCVSGIAGEQRRLLSVEGGERGLRQSDAVFLHTRNMTELLPRLLNGVDTKSIAGIGVSVCPSSRENSYMPVFLVGKLLAETLGAALGVPVCHFTHQQGHIRAALFGNEGLRFSRFMAFHLSGGTSELLGVDDTSGEPEVSVLGGSSDINAGQLVDRLGVRMGLEFPAGKAFEALAAGAKQRGVLLPASVNGLRFSFSGAETKAARALESGVSAADVAFSVYDLIARTLAKTILNAMDGGGIPDHGQSFLLAGGVASSALLRSLLEKRLESSGAKLYYADPSLASDNAVGAALLAMDRITKG